MSIRRNDSTKQLQSGGVEATDTPPSEEALREIHNKVLSLNYGAELEIFMTN
jgi:hypothetical protein